MRGPSHGAPRDPWSRAGRRRVGVRTAWEACCGTPALRTVSSMPLDTLAFRRHEIADAIHIVRLDPALQEARGHRQMRDALDHLRQFEAAEPAGEHVFPELGPQATADALPGLRRETAPAAASDWVASACSGSKCSMARSMSRESHEDRDSASRRCRGRNPGPSDESRWDTREKRSRKVRSRTALDPETSGTVGKLVRIDRKQGVEWMGTQ